MLAYPLKPDAADELPDDPSFIIEKNRYYRKHGFFGLTWPQHYFAFGGDGTGNQYFFDLSLDPSPVFSADHEAKEFVIESPSFMEWLERQKENQVVVEAEQVMEESDEYDNGCLGAFIGGCGVPVLLLAGSLLYKKFYPPADDFSFVVGVALCIAFSAPLGIIVASVICMIRVQRILSWFKRKR